MSSLTPSASNPEISLDVSAFHEQLFLEAFTAADLFELSRRLTTSSFIPRAARDSRRRDVEAVITASDSGDFVHFAAMTLAGWDRESGNKTFVKLVNTGHGLLVDTIMEKPPGMGADSREQIILPRIAGTGDRQTVEEIIQRACCCVGRGTACREHGDEKFSSYCLFLPADRL